MPTVIDPALVTSHSVTLTGLNPSSNYTFTIRSRSASGKVSASTGSFTTAAPAALRISASPGSFSLVGNVLSFGQTKMLPAAVGGIALTGFGAGLDYVPPSRVLFASLGTFALTGQPSLRQFGMPAAAGSVALTGVAAALTYTPAGFSWVTDSLVHAPPTTGPYAYSPPYGTFIPNNAGFPALAGTYVDPVFGTTIKRLSSNSLTVAGGGDIYAKNGWWNSDATYFINTFADSTVGAIKIADGTVQPLTNAGGLARTDASCAPNDPDVFYYFSGASLKQQSISTGTITNKKTFGATLGPLGGSVDWIDNSGQYMLLNVNGGGATALRVWDSVNDILFTGTITDDPSTGWAAMSPDASYVIVCQGTDKRRYAIDKTAHTVASTGTIFFSGAGDHGDIIKCSDGNTYLVRTNNDSIPALIQRINVATGTVTTFFTFPSDTATYWGGQPDHYSCVSKAGGAWSDWCFFSSDIEGGPNVASDNFTGTDPVASWSRFQNEIYAINVLTAAVRRVAHTRTRETLSNYAYFPRVCVSWDGTKVAWASNMGYKSTPLGYSDIYAIALPNP